MSRENNFEQAFRANHAGCRGVCDCGKSYYNSSGVWDFEEGELEELEKSDAINSIYSIGYINLEGSEYIDVCPCRDDRVETILNFIDSHSSQIAEYLNLESSQMMAKAKEMEVGRNSN